MDRETPKHDAIRFGFLGFLKRHLFRLHQAFQLFYSVRWLNRPFDTSISCLISFKFLKPGGKDLHIGIYPDFFKPGFHFRSFFGFALNKRL